MKYLKLYTLLFLSGIFIIYAQPKSIHYNNWIFGDNAGITFTTNDGNPEPLDNGDSYSFIEGTSSISDDNGILLYYLYLTGSEQFTYLKTGGLTQV
ncbi:hypothetical protein, partial [Psychroserpens sp.]|uniref:hypothetical protein n=1 Tax=Psychroserpens sp. TaxID=2020870 RepID=UPI002B274B15